jgi:enoyl-[acyl-carrier protein] reductase II
VVPKTRLTQEYQLEIPFVNAGMAFVATAPLATAVCNAGGLGMIGIAAMSPPVLRAQIDDIRRATSRPFGVNIIARFSTPEQIDVLVEGRVPVVVFFWDEAPADWIARLRAAGSKIWFEIGSVAEARAAMARGAEAFVVQGVEASGHNRSSAGRCHSCRRFELTAEQRRQHWRFEQKAFGLALDCWRAMRRMPIPGISSVY